MERFGDVPELDLDVDGPVFEVLGLVDAHFARGLDLGEVFGEGLADLADERVKLGLPPLSYIRDLDVELFKFRTELVELARHRLDLCLPGLELTQSVLVPAADQTLQSRVDRDHLCLPLLQRPLFDLIPDRPFFVREVCLHVVALLSQTLTGPEKLPLSCSETLDLRLLLIQKTLFLSVLGSDLLEFGVCLNLDNLGFEHLQVQST